MRSAMARPSLTTVLTCLIALAIASPCRAQSATTLDDAANNKGLRPDRAYFSPEPFEHFDTMSGNVVLTFTDLVLPGNAGAHSQLQRTYNNQLCHYSYSSGQLSASGESMALCKPSGFFFLSKLNSRPTRSSGSC
jgi:hypothetical protein